MTSARQKKIDTEGKPQEEVKETSQPAGKDESFLDTSEDDLTKKRKMILTGIAVGVAVAGMSAAALLFFGPYSPFGMKSSEKPANLPNEQKLYPSFVEDKAAVQVPQEVSQQVAPASATTNATQAVSPPVDKEVAKHEIKEAPPVVKAPVRKEKAPPKVAIAEKVPSSAPSSYNYDIQDGGPIVDAPSTKKIIVSRDPSFNTIYMQGESNSSGKFRISIPPPGNIYWKEAGKKQVHKITVNPPTSTGLQASIPAQAKIGENISWSSTGKVSFYRVEVASDAEFINRVKVYSTNKTSIPLGNIGVGKWFIKISALNLQSGTWDTTNAMPINVEALNPPPKQETPVAEESQQAQPNPASETEQSQAPQTEEKAAASGQDSSAVPPVEPVKPVDATTEPIQETEVQPAEEQ
jgi:hypothetical protein